MHAHEMEVGLVSIITPAYNASEFLIPLLDSVEQQSHQRIEHIIIDDGSKDGGKTVDILSGRKGLTWWTRPNAGQYATINEALRRARGEFFLVICADDLLASSTVIARLVSALRDHPDWMFVCGDTQIINAQGDFVRRWPSAGRCFLPKWLWDGTVYAPHCSVLVRTAHVMANSLWFDESMRFAADRAWLLGLLRSSCNFGFVRLDVSKYREHSTNLTITLGSDLKSKEEAEVFQRFRVTRLRRRIAGLFCRWVNRLLVRIGY
jgi:glycosyltransferase involved in cell wall biosynthesis